MATLFQGYIVYMDIIITALVNTEKEMLEQWNHTVAKSMSQGAGLIHRLSKQRPQVQYHPVPHKWPSCAFRDEVEHFTNLWATVWQEPVNVSASPRYIFSDIQPLPPITTEQVRISARCFRPSTSVVDGIHPRKFATFPEDHRAFFAEWLNRIELQGAFP